MNSQTFGIGKPTRRGIRKCNKCGVLNGTKSMVCKNKECDMIFKDSTEKKKCISDAIQLITMNVRKLYSVRISEHGLDNRGFVQLPSMHSLNINNSNQFNEVALCFVDNCPRLLHNSFLSNSCHSCEHIAASLKSHTIASPLPLKLESILKLKAAKEIQEKLWMIANESDIHLVQRVSKNVMVIRCQVTPKHPLGYLHFIISRDRNDKFGKFFCNCSENIKIYKCIHYYLCVCALASDPKYAQEFKGFINMELEEERITSIVTTSKLDLDSVKILTAKHNRKVSNVETIIKSSRRKRKKTEGTVHPIIRRKIWPKIYPIQINIMNDRETNNEDANPIWRFDNWLSFVVESMNKLMTFENAGIMNNLVYNIPWDFYRAFRSKIPSMYTVEVQSVLKYELLHIMNISHVKEIFHKSKVKLKVSKRFVLSENSVYIEIDENRELSEEIMPHFIYFLNVGQLTVDDSDNTNNSFTIEWIHNFDNVGIGQLKLQYKYGRKCL